jgi:ankyrin repeat protein
MLFITKWDAAGSGANMKLQKMIDTEGVEKVLTDKTFWLGNTVMHLAARYANLDTIKLLMPYSTGKQRGFETVANKAGKSPIEYAKFHSKDVNVLTTIEGLLNKLHTSTKVIKNAEIKLEKAERKAKVSAEVQ